MIGITWDNIPEWGQRIESVISHSTTGAAWNKSH